MPDYSQVKIIHRIIDANINRAKEGLRVCEEITRFILNSRGLSFQFKQIRHKLDTIFKYLPSKFILIKERESAKDVGRNIHIAELKRRDYQDIFFANIQRVKESLRVLEEFSKLKEIKIALKFKSIRYRIYEIEKRVAEKFSALCSRR